MFFLSNILYCQSLNSAVNGTNEIDTNKLYPAYWLDIEPQFPGGKDSLINFIHQNVKLTKNQMEYEGIICVCITFDRDGLIRSYYVPGEAESFLFHPLFEELFNKFPKWEPGVINGIKVKTMICLPFIIQLM